MHRRSFLRLLGIGATAAAVLPVEELIDRLAFARSPTKSIYMPGICGQIITDVIRTPFGWETRSALRAHNPLTGELRRIGVRAQVSTRAEALGRVAGAEKILRLWAGGAGIRVA